MDFEKLKKIYGNLNFNKELLEHQLSVLKDKYPKIFNYDINLNAFENIPEFKRIVVDSRNDAAVMIMISSMLRKSVKVGTIIFGRGHTEGLMKEFINQTGSDASILVSEP